MKPEKKHPQSKKENTQTITKKQLSKQENQDYELKIQKVQKEICSRNLEIEYLHEEKKFKDNTFKTLQKERKKLENCFLFKNIQKQKQPDRQNEKKQTNITIQKVKNRFRDVNEKIVQFIEQLQAIKQNQKTCLAQERNDSGEQSPQFLNIKLECQSLHLKQIFNPEQTLNHEKKALKLREKLYLLYDKIHLSLEQEEPYLHEKILERIKRQAQSQTRKKMLQQIDKLIKQNSVWMSQETNRVNNQLEEKKIEEMCVNNLGLMKKIMAMKVSNNDWIFENYGHSNFTKESNSAFPVQKISKLYQEVLKRFHEDRVADQLSIVRRKDDSEDEENSRESLKQIFSKKITQNFLQKDGNTEQPFKEQQQNLLQKLEELQKRIEKIEKR